MSYELVNVPPSERFFMWSREAIKQDYLLNEKSTLDMD